MTTSARASGPCLTLHSVPSSSVTANPGLTPTVFLLTNVNLVAGLGARSFPHGPSKRLRSARSFGASHSSADWAGVDGPVRVDRIIGAHALDATPKRER